MPNDVSTTANTTGTTSQSTTASGSGTPNASGCPCLARFKAKFNEHLTTFVVGFVMCVVKSFGFITWPIYYLYQKPWTRLEKANRIRATRKNLADPNSPYFRIGELRSHYLKEVHTIPEAQQQSLHFNDPNLKSLGYRETMEIKMQYCDIEKKMMKKFILSDYQWLTIGQVNQKIGLLETAFRSIGLEGGQRVLIYSETRMEWFLCAHAILRIGSAIATLYSTLDEAGVKYGIEETKVKIIVTNEELLDRLPKPISDQLETIVYFSMPAKSSAPSKLQDFIKQSTATNKKLKVISYEEFLEQGKKSNKTSVSTKDSFKVVDTTPAVILYTSGSTGKPKGVILTHRNFMCAVRSVLTVISQEVADHYQDNSWYGYLPLAHVLEFVAEMAMFCSGIEIGYGSPYTMTDYSSGIQKGDSGDLTLLKPTIFPGVPLVLERIRKLIIQNIEKSCCPNLAMKLITKLAEYKNSCLEKGYETPIIDRMMCQKFRGPFGGNVHYMMIGGAPLSGETQLMIRSLLNVKILIGFGSTETCGANCVMDLEDITIGNIGAPLYGVLARLVDWTEGGYTTSDRPHPRGELHIGGEGVSGGYLEQAELTTESFYQSDGVQWFRTGDIAEVNELGMFKIIDRKKDLVKLQHGEYVSLGKVEAELKNCPLVDNICVYGDSAHNHIIALIMPNWNGLKTVANEYLKVDNLDIGRVKALCDSTKSEYLSFCAKVSTVLERYCRTQTKLSKNETPLQTILCKDDWTPDNDMLTAAMKIKRYVIVKVFRTQIDQLYAMKTNQ